MNEISGMSFDKTDSTIICINDGGNEPVIYKTKDARNFSSHKLTIENIDWEELSIDENNFYIADFGNNSLNRDTLKIFILDKDFKNSNENAINFVCNHQVAPFNFEAMFDIGDSLFLITKKQKSKYCYIFSLPKQKGTYNIAPFDSAKIKGKITGADYDENLKRLVLVGYKNYFPFIIIKENANSQNAIKKPYRKKLFISKPALQTEAVAIKSKKEIIISAEKNPLRKAAMYFIKLKTD